MDSEKQCQSNAERQHTYRLKLRKKGLERVEIKLSKESKQLHKKLCRDSVSYTHLTLPTMELV